MPDRCNVASANQRNKSRLVVGGAMTEAKKDAASHANWRLEIAEIATDKVEAPVEAKKHLVCQSQADKIFKLHAAQCNAPEICRNRPLSFRCCSGSASDSGSIGRRTCWSRRVAEGRARVLEVRDAKVSSISWYGRRLRPPPRWRGIVGCCAW